MTSTVRTGSSDGRRRTLAQIADSAGVSVSTVSKVLHNRSDVSAETRAKVQRLLEQHGYLAKHHPAATAAPPGGLIDFVINELDSPWAVELIRGAEDVLHDAGMGLVVSATHGRTRRARQWLDSLATRPTRGAILVVPELTPGQHEELAGSASPTRWSCRSTNPPRAHRGWARPTGPADWRRPGTSSNWATNASRSSAAPSGKLTSRARVDGYRSALAEAELPFDPELVRYGDFTHPLAHQHALELLALPDRPTAIFAYSDHQALGTYRAAAELGLRIPADVSVVGFDDLPFADWVTPRLTTIRTPWPT